MEKQRQAQPAPAQPTLSERSGPRLYDPQNTNWPFIIKFLLFSTVFWLIQFFLQFYWLVSGDLVLSLIRSLGLSGATFFGFALLSSTVFKFKPTLARYWYVRRSFGVMGFVFVFFHVGTVINLGFGGNLAAVYYSLNPFENPMIFGALAYPIFFLLAITSTDWAVAKLGASRWKTLHRLVYFGYYAVVFHFLLMARARWTALPTLFLISVTSLALAGQLYWFYQTASKRGFRTLGTVIGIFLIILYLVTAFLAFAK